MAQRSRRPVVGSLAGAQRPVHVSVMVSDTDLATAWEKIILKPSVKQDLLGMIRAFNRVDEPVPKGLLLYGPPGTGKSLIGRCIGQSAGDGFMPVWIGLLKAPYVGQSG